LPFPGCILGPFLPAPGKPCFSLIQENLTTADVGRSVVIDENTNSDFATITSLLANGSSLAAQGFTYPSGIVPALPVANAPLGWLDGGGVGFDTPGFPNADITQLQFTLTSLCMSNNDTCSHTPNTKEDMSFSARLDVYGEPAEVPEPSTFAIMGVGLLVLALTVRWRLPDHQV
jgi:hypothetical protein